MRFALFALLLPALAWPQTPSRDDVLRAIRRAADFYRHKVSTEGDYHYYYAAITTPPT